MAPPLEEPNPKDTFPYEALDFETGDRIKINTREEVWEHIAGWPVPDEFKYSRAINRLISPKNIIDTESQSLIKMYDYCKEMGTAPFPGSYGDQPTYWLDARDIIVHNLASAQEAKANLDKDKR